MKNRRDIEQEITDKVIEQLESGTAPWQKSWASIGGLALRETGQPYRGFNQFILSMSGFANPYWLTYKKAEELGGKVRKGEKGTHVCFFGIGKDKKDDTKTFKFIKWYCVFNASQIDGFTGETAERFNPAPRDITPMQRDSEAETFINNTGADIQHGGDRACYIPSIDAIRLPTREDFDSSVAYYGTALHELAHWTGAASRLDRDLKTGFGTKDYAQEELTAEMGAAFLCGHLSLEPTVREDHAQYIASWLKRLKEDKKALGKACAAAQRVVDHLYEYQEEEATKAA